MPILQRHLDKDHNHHVCVFIEYSNIDSDAITLYIMWLCLGYLHWDKSGADDFMVYLFKAHNLAELR